MSTVCALQNLLPGAVVDVLGVVSEVGCADRRLAIVRDGTLPAGICLVPTDAIYSQLMSARAVANRGGDGGSSGKGVSDGDDLVWCIRRVRVINDVGSGSLRLQAGPETTVDPLPSDSIVRERVLAKLGLDAVRVSSLVDIFTIAVLNRPLDIRGSVVGLQFHSPDVGPSPLLRSGPACESVYAEAVCFKGCSNCGQPADRDNSGVLLPCLSCLRMDQSHRVVTLFHPCTIALQDASIGPAGLVGVTATSWHLHQLLGSAVGGTPLAVADVRPALARLLADKPTVRFVVHLRAEVDDAGFLARRALHLREIMPLMWAEAEAATELA